MNRRRLLKNVALLPFMAGAVAAIAQAVEAKQWRKLVIFREGEGFSTGQLFSAARPNDIIWIVSPGDEEHGKCYEVGKAPVYIDKRAGYGFPAYPKPHMDFRSVSRE
jgi:hypothetical protein